MELGEKQPDEVIIVFMGSHNVSLEYGNLNVRQVEVGHRQDDMLPLAQARNLGADTAGIKN